MSNFHAPNKYIGFALTMGTALCAGAYIGCQNFKAIATVISKLNCPVFSISAACSTALAIALSVFAYFWSAKEKKPEFVAAILGPASYVVGAGAAILAGNAAIELSVETISAADSVRSVTQYAGIIGFGLGLVAALVYHYGDVTSKSQCCARVEKV